MKILMFGRTGQVAQEVLRRAGGVEIEALSRAEADLTDPEGCAARIAATDAAVVINAAAWTDVDGAEAAEAEAVRVNGEAPTEMAAAAAARGLPFLHISTDYVFDGAPGRAWSPADREAPINAYGWSKLAGERGVAGAGGPHVILRTAWVFSAHGKNFVKTMLRLGGARDALSIVDDQIGGPTPAAAIADALLTIAGAWAAGRGKSGVYHFAGAPTVSWRVFAEAIFAAADLQVAVTPIATKDYPTPAARPLNSALMCGAIAADYGIAAPDWRAGLAEVLRELESDHA